MTRREWLTALPSYLLQKLLENPTMSISGEAARAVIAAGGKLQKLPWSGSDPTPLYTLTGEDQAILGEWQASSIASDPHDA